MEEDKWILKLIDMPSNHAYNAGNVSNFLHLETVMSVFDIRRQNMIICDEMDTKSFVIDAIFQSIWVFKEKVTYTKSYLFE